MSLSLRLQEPFELLNSNAKCVNTVPKFNPSSLSHCLHHPRLVCQNLLNQLELWDRNKWCEGMKGRNVKVKVVKRIHFLLSCHYYCSSHSLVLFIFLRSFAIPQSLMRPKTRTELTKASLDCVCFVCTAERVKAFQLLEWTLSAESS